MPYYSGSIYTKQFCHLALRQPHSLLLQLDLKLGTAVIRCIENDGRTVIGDNCVIAHIHFWQFPPFSSRTLRLHRKKAMAKQQAITTPAICEGHVGR